MTTPNYHPTPPKVAPRSEKSTELSSSKPASANPKMKEKGTSEKPTKRKMKENDNGACLHRENPPDPLDLKHDNNVRKAEERRNQDDKDVSIEDQAFERTAIKIKQDLSVVHKLFKEVDDIEGAPSLDDESFRKQQEVVDATIQLMRHDEPIDTRDDKMVYIERLAGVAKLERDGRIEECYEDALADIPGTTQGTSYLKHDIVF
ncbi:hypothetical protein ZWY2020_024726 [Hordeum vulgare]|nr:hypothetical protein ZWY2020_024726 [Hordeum vulgare]